MKPWKTNFELRILGLVCTTQHCDREQPCTHQPFFTPHLALSCSAEGFAHTCGHSVLRGQALSTSPTNSHPCSTAWPQECMCFLHSCCKTNEGKSRAVGSCLAGRYWVNGLEGGRAEILGGHVPITIGGIPEWALECVSPRPGACVML